MKETVEQFIARGGVVKQLDAQKVPEINHVLPVKSSISMDTADLATGADLYSESATTPKHPNKVKTLKKFKLANIKASLLPKSLLGLLHSLGEETDVSRSEE